MKSTLIAPGVAPEALAPEAAASEHASKALAQPPGRDFAVFLLLLLALDASSVLHIYNLTRLYNEYLFLGVGLFFVLCALVLLLLPRYGLPPWLRFPVRGPRAVLGVLGGMLCLGVAGASIFLLVRSVSHAPDWYLSAHPEGVLGVQIVRVLLLASMGVRRYSLRSSLILSMRR